MTHPSTMQAITIAHPGGPEVLTPQAVPVPEPRTGEVLIRVAAAGLNGADLLQRRGNYDPPPDASPLLGLEVSGEIVALGAGVADWKPGAHVVALTNGGGYAEYAAVPAGQVLPLPPGYTLVEGAALPETLFTVFQTLIMRAGLEPGMTVLVHGASGGIGGAAILICSALGARTLAVVSSPEKAAYAQRLGADATIDRITEDVVARTLALTDGKGADRIVDVVGGDTTTQNIDAAARGGHIILIAIQGGGRADLPLGKLLGKQLTLSGSTLRPQSSATKAAIATGLHHRIWPGLADLPKPELTTFPLAGADDAHRAFEGRTLCGKIVLVTPFGGAGVP